MNHLNHGVIAIVGVLLVGTLKTMLGWPKRDGTRPAPTLELGRRTVLR